MQKKTKRNIKTATYFAWWSVHAQRLPSAYAAASASSWSIRSSYSFSNIGFWPITIDW